MNYPSLREFIHKLEREEELLRIKEPVSPILEITEITDRISKQPGGGKALLFENVEGSAMSVLINAFGSARRMNMALGVHDIEDIPKRIERYIKIPPPSTLLDKAKLLPMLLQASQFPPKLLQTTHPPCQEIVHLNDDIDLGKIPVLQCWPDDAGRFITFPIVINRSADKKIRNVGLYRMQVYDKKTTAMHWHIHKDGAHFFHEYKKLNKVMEVAIALGADPASCYSASAPLPYGIDEMRLEGPFGDHTGYYSQDGDYPVLHLTAITHRKDPIYLTTIVGKPPQEDFYLGRATERIFLPLLKTQLPEIADMNMPAEGVFHNCVIVSIDKRYPMQSRRIMSALWGLGQMSFVKIIITVDSKVNVHDYEEVTKILLSTVDFETDLFFSEGILDVLNHASDQVLYGSKLGIDLTSKIEGEPGYGKKVTARTELKTLPTPEMVTETFQELTACQIIELEVPILLVALDKQTINQGAKFIDAFLDHQDFSAIEIVIVLERHVNLSNISIVMWKLFNNLDPKRDFYFKNNRLGIDVTKKLPEEGYQQHWPEEIEMSSAVKTKVNKKWDTLFKE